MKRSTALSVFTISALLAGAPVLSSAGRYGSYGVEVQGGENEQYAPEGQKDECLLVAMNCANATETIQQRIDRLNHEIQKGTDVYTPEELNTLKRQLNDEYKYLYDLNKPGDGHRTRMRH
jgi:hypothetical protein